MRPGGRRLGAAAAVLLVAFADAPAIAAQTLRVTPVEALPAFEVATVKKADPVRPATRVVAPDRVHRPVTTAMDLVMEAFGIQRYRVVNMPEWAAGSRFEVLGKTPRQVTGGDVGPYLQRLLAERFGLRAHVESRDLPFYELTTVDRNGRLGPRLSRTRDDCDAITAERTRNGVVGPPIPRTPGAERAVCMYYVYATVTPGGQRSIRYMSGGAPISKLADHLAGPAGRVVIDRTGLTGLFDVDLQYTLVNTGAAPVAASGDDPPEVFTAAQEQLGLRLQAARGPIDVLVIDALSPPSEN